MHPLVYTIILPRPLQATPSLHSLPSFKRILSGKALSGFSKTGLYLLQILRVSNDAKKNSAPFPVLQLDQPYLLNSTKECKLFSDVIVTLLYISELDPE
jgi:hypothetical protein